MRSLNLDYQRNHLYRLRLGWLILIAALILSAYLIQRHNALQFELENGRLRLSSKISLTDSKNAHTVSEKLSAEMTVADSVARHMALPWGELFKALENSAHKEVALLQVKPDTTSKTLTLVAEAKNLAAMTAYLNKLSKQAVFYSVHLVEHEVLQQESPPRVRFTVSAAWKMNSMAN